MHSNNGTLSRRVCKTRARVPAELVVIDQETEAIVVRRDGTAILREPSCSDPIP
jgi:hypothetical protein